MFSSTPAASGRHALLVVHVLGVVVGLILEAFTDRVQRLTPVLALYARLVRGGAPKYKAQKQNDIK